MDDIRIKALAQAVAESVDFSDLFPGCEQDVAQVGFWIDAAYKQRFDKLQKRSQKRFGKIAKQVLMHLIDQADRDDVPEAG